MRPLEEQCSACGNTMTLAEANRSYYDGYYICRRCQAADLELAKRVARQKHAAKLREMLGQ